MSSSDDPHYAFKQDTRALSNPFAKLFTAIKTRYLNLNFGYRVIIGASLVIFIVALTGAIVTTNTATVLETQTQDDLERTSNLQHTQTDIWLENIKRQTVFLSQNQILQDGSPTEISNYLTKHQSSFPTEVADIHYVEHTDEATTILASTSTNSEGTTVTDRPWKTATPDTFSNSDDVHLSTVYQTQTNADSSYTNEVPAMAFSTAIPGDSTHTIVIETDLSKASLNLDSPPNGRTFLANHDGTVILSTNPDSIGNDVYELGFIDQSTWQLAHSENSAYETSYFTDDVTVNDDSQATGMTHIDQADWVAFTQEPDSSAYSLRNQIQTSMILLITGVLLATGFVGIIVGIPVIRDLNNLSSTAQEVADGNYEVTITTNRKDQFGDLYRTVDAMRNSLQRRIKEAQDLNDQIRRVVERQSNVMNGVANGNLTRRMDANTGMAPLDSLARDFNRMVEDVEQMVIEIEKSEEDMEQFTFVATHDLQEPLRMIRTYSELLETEYNDELDGEAQEYMDFILEGSERIKYLLDDLYSFLRAKMHDNEFNSHDLENIIRDAQNVEDTDLTTANATINVGDMPDIRADDRQIREVFEHLFENAVTYSRDGVTPEITIEADHNENGYHEITFSDNGIGIPEDQYEKIFDVFNRIERNDSDGGTGIGLAVCKRIIEDHGGDIWVDSTVGKGTTFHFTLPSDSMEFDPTEFEMQTENTD